MLKHILAVLMLASMVAVFGCGSPATPSSTDDIESFFAGSSPIHTGIVGNYTYTSDDGSIDTGSIVRGDDGQISMQSDRGASVYYGVWFDIFVDYDPADVRYYTGMGLPVYYIGDTFSYDINITNKTEVPFNIPGMLYACMTSHQRYWPGGGLLPGASTEVWCPFYIDAYETLIVPDDFTIVAGTQPGNDATWVTIKLRFMNGECEFCMDSGACGFWDP